MKRRNGRGAKGGRKADGEREHTTEDKRAASVAASPYGEGDGSAGRETRCQWQQAEQTVWTIHMLNG